MEDEVLAPVQGYGRADWEWWGRGCWCAFRRSVVTKISFLGHLFHLPFAFSEVWSCTRITKVAGTLAPHRFGRARRALDRRVFKIRPAGGQYIL